MSAVAPAHARLIFTNDIFDNEAEIFRIGEGDDASGTDLALQFGSTNTETLGWDSANGWFEITDDFSLEGNEIKSVVLDNQSSAPGSPSAGQVYHNTTDNNTYVYNGSGWEAINTQTTLYTTAPVAQARRTTDLTLTTEDTWYDVTLDTVDVETDTSVLEGNDTSTDRIDIKETGLYKISYQIAADSSASAGWSKYFEFTVESDNVSGSGTLSSYPVYFDMSLAPSGFWSDYDAGTDHDLIITDEAGDTRYPAEVVYMDESGGSGNEVGELYFKTDLSGSSDTTFRLYYDNPNVSAQPAVSDTYGANNVWTLYEGVWHMNSTSETNSSASRELNETTGGTINTDSGGQIGGAIDFNGSTGYIQIDRPVEDDFTISFWMNADGNSNTGSQWWEGNGLVDSELSGSYNDFGIAYLNNEPVFGSGPSSDITLSSGNTVNDSSWHYVAVTRVQSTGLKRLFVDNHAAASQTGTTNSFTDPDYTRFGAIQTGAYFYDGSIDEIRITSDIRSDDWIATERVNINSPATFFASVDSSTSSANPTLNTRVRTNDASVLNGSSLIHLNYPNEYNPVTATFFASLTASDFITLQAMRSNSGSVDLINETTLTVEKIEKMQGQEGSGPTDITGTTANTFTLDSDDTGGNVRLRFGTALAETLIWDSSLSAFNISDDLSVNGSINQYGTSFTLDADNTGSGATVQIAAEQGSDSNGVLRYSASARRWEMSNNGGSFYPIAAGAGGDTLEGFYNYGGAGAGRTIDIDSGAVELTVSDTDNNAALILNQNDTTNNPNTLEITNTGSGFGLLVDSGDGIFDEDVVVGGSTLRTPDVTGFTMGGDDLFVAGTAGVEGTLYTDGALVAGNGLTISDTYIRDSADLVIQSDSDTDDYIYFDATSNEEYLYFEDASLAYTNDPGFRLNSTTGELEYRDEDESAWTSIDSLAIKAPTWNDAYDNGRSVTVDSGAVDLNGTGEVLEIGDGTANDAYITFDDGTNRQLGWDDSQTALSTFDQQLGFRVIQSASPPVTCGSTYAGMQWMDTDTGILYICDTSNSRNKWLSVMEETLYGEEGSACPAGQDVDSNDYCNVDWGNGLGPDDGSSAQLGLYVPYPVTITGYSFSSDSTSCSSGSFDVEVWSTGSASDDNSYTMEQEVGSGLTGELGNSSALNLDLAGNQYIIFGLDNNCTSSIDDYNIFLYYRYRHD